MHIFIKAAFTGFTPSVSISPHAPNFRLRILTDDLQKFGSSEKITLKVTWQTLRLLDRFGKFLSLVSPAAAKLASFIGWIISLVMSDTNVENSVLKAVKKDNFNNNTIIRESAHW